MTIMYCRVLWLRNYFQIGVNLYFLLTCLYAIPMVKFEGILRKFISRDLSSLSSLLLLIFAALSFRDFQKVAKLKTRENLFLTFFIVFLLYYVLNVFLAKARKLSAAKHARFISAKLSSRENK